MRVGRFWAGAAVIAAVLASARPATAAARVPDGFLWGVSNSGFQSEGSFPDSNWTRYLAQKKDADPYGRSADFYHRYPEDIALAAGLGVQVFRTSVEWARVEPAQGVRDEAELARYDDVIDRIEAAGMRPMITLEHWVHPGWVADRGGWRSDWIVDRWLDHVRFLVDRYRGRGIIWITLNELRMAAGMEAANGGLPVWAMADMRRRAVIAHRRAYGLIHALDPGALVSTNIAYAPTLGSALDWKILDALGDTLDFLGLDYYFGSSPTNKTSVRLLLGRAWDVVPEPAGLLPVLREYHQRRPGLPIYIVESGMITDNGKLRDPAYTRADHLRDHVYWIQRAVAEGIPVMGFNYWTLTDDYQWGTYRMRLGLYSVDVLGDPALRRVPTDAVPAYRRLIADGGVPDSYVPRPRRDIAPG